MYKLGGSVIGFSDPGSSSVAKGESLKDTIVMMSNYADLIVIRNPMEGAARAASLYSRVPVINAGDGGHLHPTQTLADLTTIRMHTGGIKNLNVGICGDLMNGRTVHSLIKALSGFPDIRFYFISPRELKIPDYIRYFLDSNKQKYIEITSLEATVSSLDVLYMTRIQRERFDSESEYERHRHAYILTSGKLSDAKSSLLIMHPLPADEISVDVDNDPRALYFAQARTARVHQDGADYDNAENAPAEPRETEVGGAACKPRCVSMFEKYSLNLDIGARAGFSRILRQEIKAQAVSE